MLQEIAERMLWAVDAPTVGTLSTLLAAAGASTGKAVSDGLQFLFGDKKTAEQRKMEEALAALQGRYI